MQPAWRKGESLEKSAPADANWMPLMRGGTNGLSVAIMALSWWVHAVTPPDTDLSAAIDDVKWVLSEFVMILSSATAETGTKRRGEPSIDEPRSKR